MTLQKRHRRRFVCIALGCTLALLAITAGCVAPAMTAPQTAATTTVPAPTPVAVATAEPTADAAQIMAGLLRTGSLQEAAAQCAEATGAPPDAARIRIEVDAGDQCMPCSRIPLEYMDRGVPLTEVELPLAEAAWVWLTVDEWLCMYLYDGQEFKPTSVTRW